MNIAIDIRCLMNPNYSGVAQYTYNLLDQLFKLDKENQYKLFYNSGQDISKNLPKFEHSNVEFYGFKYPNKLLNSAFLFLNYPEIEKMINGCDVFFIPNPNFCALAGTTKKVLTIHDLSFELYPQFFSLKQKLWHKFIRPRYLISHSDKVIADSINTKNDLQNRYKIPAEKITVIYPGINHEIYQPIDRSHPKLLSIIEKYQLPAKFILYLGTIEPRKNIGGIIEAFNRAKAGNTSLADLNLVIAGDKGWKFNNVFTTAEKSPFTDQITFLGYIPESDKSYLYNLAELFIFPSYYEGFGLPVLEAQACGIPVIAGLNSSFPEVLADSAVLVNPDNLSEIARAITQILTDQNLKQSLIDRGLTNAQKFSWQNCAQETLNYLIS
ncbi:MAG: glycosyltransferase family 1 protein [Candidatus Parcubacteria bacterium]|nr:glycosyltransferase family 1 protein [Candidatus Parcubacteria bacterium]